MFSITWAVSILLSLGFQDLSAVAWIVPQPKKNIWMALAKTFRQDHLCLSAAAAADSLLSTCLVGIPYSPAELPKLLTELKNKINAGKVPHKILYLGGHTYQLKLAVDNPMLL